ncbi:Metallo-peptidase family M12-domain-containing protein [Auriculariales sp. MPI-PUGE-AT-0066]|nr:Metallo-peptidase family M12-domain-containing protein [Auriculariales sp. MPI-PUGE-AT-0066]
MFSSKRIATCAFIFSSFLHSSLFDGAQASSLPKPPLGHVEHPVVRSLDVFPRYGAAANAALKKRRDAPELHHSDSFRLTLSAFDETYHLHLKPNDDLVHPAARINYYRPGPDGGSELYRTEPLLRESVRAYQGEVVRADDDYSATRRLQEDAAGGLYRTYDAPLPSNVLGWARIVVHSEGDPVTGEPPSFEGAFSINGDIHHVSAYDSYILTRRSEDALPRAPTDPLDRHLVIYRNSDSVYQSEERPQSCAHDSLAWNTDPTVNPALRPPAPVPTWYESLLPTNFTRRDDINGNNGATNNFASTIGQTDGCPKTQRIVYMGVAADCKYVSNYQSPQNATKAILTDWNNATGKYKNTFNVSLGIVQLDVHDVVCPLSAPQDAPWNVDCSASITLNDRLSLFSAWRGQQTDNIGLWHLMSGCPTGTEVGVAWLSTLCVKAATGDAPNVVSGTAVSTFGMTEWEVVAHEIGHNFGAIHDCTSGCSLTDACCPSSATQCANPSGQLFIMNPTSSQSETTFSPCSIGNICTSLKGILDVTCLQDASVQTQSTITFQMCGNGIVEDGEDCDPGLGANSSCCDAATCKFRANAKCDPMSSSCCSTSCQFAPAGTVCRPSMDAQCDVPETCSGTTAQCPIDKTMPNGQKCGSELGETLTCASGLCTSVGQQCRLMGASLNLTRACQQQSQTGCQVSCQDPDDSSRCLVLQATLPSGSACGFGGTCSNGACVAGNLISTAKAWYVQNLQISIPVTVVAGIVVLLMVWGLIGAVRRCCSPKTGSNATRRAQTAIGGRRPDSQEGLLGAPVSMPQATHGRSRSTEVTRAGRFPHALNPPRGGQSVDMGRERPGWVDDTMYNGPRRR